MQLFEMWKHLFMLSVMAVDITATCAYMDVFFILMLKHKCQQKYEAPALIILHTFLCRRSKG